MGFPHYVLDYENTFRAAVIDEFADSYLSGATPVPCIRCNERVKFKDLLETARDLDADCMATGHYIQRKMGPAKAELHCAADAARDQSYFLFSTTQEQLDYLRFPLGHLASKAETRALAAKYGLSVADKPDSQDICFVPNGDYAAVIEKLRPGAADPGEIVDMDGTVLGEHRGVIHYTIGQRRGLGIGGLAEPLYVVRLDPDARRVVVGPKEALSTRVVPVREINWLGDTPLQSRGGMACGGENPLHAPPARRDHPPRLGHRGGGGADRGRGRREPRTGLRLLRPRRQPRAGRWLDTSRIGARAHPLHLSTNTRKARPGGPCAGPKVARCPRRPVPCRPYIPPFSKYARKRIC